MNALPAPFSDREAQGLPPGASLGQFLLGPMRNFTYLIVDREIGSVWLVDPHEELDPVFAVVREQGLRVAGVLLTHTHFDHVGGVAKVLATEPGIPVYVHPRDVARVENASYALAFVPVHDEQTLSLGTHRVRVLHLPGHSPGELGFEIVLEGERYLLSGDTLFLNDCGATHFPGGSDTEMFASLARVKALPPETILLPGHQYTRACAGRLGELIEKLSCLKAQTVQELSALP